MHAVLAFLVLSAHQASATNVTLWPAQSHPFSDISQALPKYTKAFGVHILADANYPDTKFSNVAHILASYLDNNGDGTCDNQALCDKLVANKAAMLMHSSQQAQAAAFDDPAVVGAVNSLGLKIQDNFAFENHPECTGTGATGGPGATTCRDSSIEEVLHLIYHRGISQIDSNFALVRGSSIANCMDAARGGYFASPPTQYPAGAWYTYDDSSCAYGDCQIVEYQYWALTSKLGMQGSWCPHNANFEWTLCNDTLLAASDNCVRILLVGGSTFNYTHPTQPLTGNYCTMSATTLNSAQCDALIASAIAAPAPPQSTPTPKPNSTTTPASNSTTTPTPTPNSTTTPTPTPNSTTTPTPPPAPPPAPLAVTMTVPGDVTELTSNATVKQAFETAFATDIAAVLGINASRITVTSIRAGSIVVEYSIAPKSDGTQITAAQATTALSSPIPFNAVKNSAAIPSSITNQYASPVSATVTTGTPTGSGNTNNVPKATSGASRAIVCATFMLAATLLV